MRRFLIPVFWLLASFAHAQTEQPQDPSADAPAYTLHVYTNLIQIATIVSKDGDAVKGLTPERFVVELDGSRQIKPARVRVEGDDPISLAVLLDVSGADREPTTVLATLLDSLAQQSLHVSDHLSIYAFDCSMVRSLTAAAAGSAHAGAAVERALANPALHRSAAGKDGCEGAVHLHDALGRVLRDLGDAPGRRVVIALTPGMDRGSSLLPSDLAAIATSHAISIFGVDVVAAPPRPGDAALLASVGLSPSSEEGDEWKSLCASTGGLTVQARQDILFSQLAHVIDTLRGRYIIDFQRPSKLDGGAHDLQVRVRGLRGALIRPAGAGPTVSDPKTPSAPAELAPAPAAVPPA